MWGKWDAKMQDASLNSIYFLVIKIISASSYSFKLCIVAREWPVIYKISKGRVVGLCRYNYLTAKGR